MSRTRGWIQDSGKLESLIKIVEIFDQNSHTHGDLLVNRIPLLMHNGNIDIDLLTPLLDRTGYRGNPKLSYRNLVGTRMKPKDRKVNGLIQCLIPGQKGIGIVDWACDNFLRFCWTLEFVSYDEVTDSYTITDLGIRLSQAPTEDAKYSIIKEALLQYPPVVRVLELLHEQFQKDQANPALTKFEIGKELGFKGEGGFTTYSQAIVIQALNIASDEEKVKIRGNWEGSSDKYARMISNWLKHDKIGWTKATTKIVTSTIGDDTYSAKLTAYKITLNGIAAFRTARAYSRHAGLAKIVNFEMLSTKDGDKDFLRLRRAYIIECLKTRKNLTQLKAFLTRKHITANDATIKDDIKNLKRIGLNIFEGIDSYYIKDQIEGLNIPRSLLARRITPSELEDRKNRLREELIVLNHDFLDLLDLSVNGKDTAIDFEIRIVELLNEVMAAKHLAGPNRPEIIAYDPEINPVEGIIIDSKSYAGGFPIPMAERDKMVRYIQEYQRKSVTMNRNKWWDNFKSPTYPTSPVKFSFVSSSFIGGFLTQLKYITDSTTVNGSAITAERLLVKVDNILNPAVGYNLSNFITELGSNNLVH